MQRSNGSTILLVRSYWSRTVGVCRHLLSAGLSSLSLLSLAMLLSISYSASAADELVLSDDIDNDQDNLTLTFDPDDNDPCNPDWAGVPANKDCDGDGNPAATDPNPITAMVAHDRGLASETIDILSNDDFLPNDAAAALGVVELSRVGGTCVGNASFDANAGSLFYDPSELDSINCTVVYRICNLSDQGREICTHSQFTVLDDRVRMASALDPDGDGNPSSSDPDTSSANAADDAGVPFSRIEILLNDDFLPNNHADVLGETTLENAGGNCAGSTVFDAFSGTATYTAAAGDPPDSCSVLYRVCSNSSGAQVCDTATIQIATIQVSVTDADGDTIPDAIEGSDDRDGDGLANFLDKDSDNDGLSDLLEYTQDSDFDGLPDYLDADSDNDGLSDTVEAGGEEGDRKGVVNGFTDSNGDGWNDVSAANPLPMPDTDGDGIGDLLDLDSDNDSLTDLDEIGGAMLDLNGDGKLDNTEDANANGIADSGESLTVRDSDADGQPDYLDLDSDNDGIFDLVESGAADSDGNGIADSWQDDDGDGIPNSVDADYTGGSDNDGDGIDDFADSTFVDALDSDADGIIDQFDVDAEGDGFASLIGGGLQQQAANGSIRIGLQGNGCTVGSRHASLDPLFLLVIMASMLCLLRRSRLLKGAALTAALLLVAGCSTIDRFGGSFQQGADPSLPAAAQTDETEGVDISLDSLGDDLPALDSSEALLTDVNQIDPRYAPDAAGVHQIDTASTGQEGGAFQTIVSSSKNVASKMKEGVLRLTRFGRERADADTGQTGLPETSAALSASRKFQRHAYASTGLGASWLQPDTSEVQNIDVNDRVHTAGQIAIGADVNRHVSIELHSTDLGSAGLSPEGRIAYRVHGGSALLYAGKNRSRHLRGGVTAYGRIGVGMLDDSPIGNVSYVAENDTHLLLGAGLEYATRFGLGVRAEVISFDADARYGQIGLIYRVGGQHGNRAARSNEVVGSIEPSVDVPSENTAVVDQAEQAIASAPAIATTEVDSHVAAVEGIAELTPALNPEPANEIESELAADVVSEVVADVASPLVTSSTVTDAAADSPAISSAVTDEAIIDSGSDVVSLEDSLLDTEIQTVLETAIGGLNPVARDSMAQHNSTSTADALLEDLRADVADVETLADVSSQASSNVSGTLAAGRSAVSDFCRQYTGVLEGVNFLPASATLTDDSEVVLADVSDRLANCPAAMVKIAAHTDNRGKALYNQQLSKQRAVVVGRYLAARGVAIERIAAFAFGESRPIVSNATENGRARNRRVELYTTPVVAK